MSLEIPPRATTAREIAASGTAHALLVRDVMMLSSLRRRLEFVPRSSWLVAVVLALGAIGACGESDETPGASVAFHAEAEPLPGFRYDTGLVPKGSPAQVQLNLSAGGAIKVDAMGSPTKADVVPRVGSGKLALDIHVKLDGRLKVESTFKSYDGELPGLKDIDIPIAGDVGFDPFLLDENGRAEVSVPIPETELPPIPLGGVPGSLVLAVATGSTLTTGFRGTCLSVSGGQATYSGEARTAGKLVIKGKIKLELPKPLDKSIDIPPFEVTIPDIATQLASDPVAVPTAEKKAGSCASQGGPGADGSANSSSGSSGTPDGGQPSPQFSVTVDGMKGTPTKAMTASEVVENQSSYTAYLYFTAPGLGSETRVIVTAVGPGACIATPIRSVQGVEYQPDDGTYETFWSTPDDGECGLSIARADGTRLTGEFSGKLTNNEKSISHEMALQFDIGFK